MKLYISLISRQFLLDYINQFAYRFSYNLILNKGIYFNINIPSLNYAACSSNQPKNMEPLSHSNVGHGNMASWPKTRDTGNKFGTRTLFSDTIE